MTHIHKCEDCGSSFNCDERLTKEWDAGPREGEPIGVCPRFDNPMPTWCEECNERHATLDAFVGGLRDLADWYEAHPEVTLPSSTVNIYPDVREFSAVARAMGSAEKEAVGSWFVLAKSFGPISLEANADRDEVCTKRVVGTRTETKRVPTAFEDREVDVEIVEWDCPSLLAGGKDASA
ncbi:MAG: hypothetical protein QF786_00050 [Vicinamibacterales bacterium]|jgi:hypothetical protein|nr:hypothetical protein [Vicinamibacterales bacterium]